MDNVREKLMELLDEIQDFGQAVTCSLGSVTVSRTDNYGVADHLIANGVTVQEWISVSERLPKPWTPVLVYRPDMVSKILVAEHGGYCDEDDDGWQRYGKDLYNNPVITHWMPLPIAPKGE